MTPHTGGCLCGDIRYDASEQPIRVTFCHCRFCQKVTGSAYAVEPIFNLSALVIRRGNPRVYKHRSDGSGKLIHSHFCEGCGTRLYYTFERFEGLAGIHAGTFDNPNWFKCSADNSKHIFLSQARHGSIIPAGINTFQEHATDNAGYPIKPTVYESHHMIDRDR